ncbi:hypothetical protein H6CHR_04090 [Variovorax sp. PBL-H6]|uniref:hypothetical protein n=1 Tax=Variovorax sp. PBL-H6 TaxID=434009 RepID=UPI00131798AB|nr:hypothetical protein [Variovorax sp. PBL-H6]VTU33875.1 hypothetical protein H6CHR_04090 [Variovorax sp. PBL-H6]
MRNFLLRFVLFLLGLVFAASLAAAVMLLAAVWGLRYGWARLTGQPVRPWVMRFDPRHGFDRFRAAGARAEPTAADMASARARGEATGSPVRLRDRGGNVTDVQARPATRAE